jgi:hypothetical protein
MIMTNSVFGTDVYWCYVRTCYLHLQGRRVGQARNQQVAPDKHMKESRCYETSVDLYRATRCYIPEDTTSHKWNSFVFIHLSFNCLQLQIHVLDSNNNKSMFLNLWVVTNKSERIEHREN